MSNKLPLTDQNLQRNIMCLQKLAILSQVIMFENLELDTDFKIPILNNFTKRIKSDCEAIQKHLKNTGRYGVRFNETTDEYSSEIYRTIDLICGLDISLIKEFNDNLQKEFEVIGL